MPKINQIHHSLELFNLINLSDRIDFLFSVFVFLLKFPFFLFLFNHNKVLFQALIYFIFELVSASLFSEFAFNQTIINFIFIFRLNHF